MKSLWDYYDGEPFMENPNLGLLTLNPRKRKRGLKMAARKRRYNAPRVHHRKRTVRRKKRTMRRNWPVAGVVVNPHRKHRRSRIHSNPRKHHRRRRRNPGMLGLGSLPSIKSIAMAGVGFASPALVQGALQSFAPSILTQVQSMGIAGKYVIKAGSIFLTHWLVKRFMGAKEAKMVLIGGGVNIVLSAVGDFAPGLLPTGSMMAYVPTPAGLRAYVPMRGGRQVAPRLGTGAGFQNEGSYGVASRFKRF